MTRWPRPRPPAQKVYPPQAATRWFHRCESLRGLTFVPAIRIQLPHHDRPDCCSTRSAAFSPRCFPWPGDSNSTAQTVCLPFTQRSLHLAARGFIRPRVILRRKAEEIFFSHTISKYIFAVRISLKQKPINPNSFFCRGVCDHWLSHPPVLLSNQGAVLHRSLSGSNFPGQETSN